MQDAESEAEKREEAIANARAIAAFAGAEVTAEMETVLHRFARGEITEDEVVAEAQRLAR